jgi:hypothetical protein
LQVPMGQIKWRKMPRFQGLWRPMGEGVSASILTNGAIK